MNREQENMLLQIEVYHRRQGYGDIFAAGIVKKLWEQYDEWYGMPQDELDHWSRERFGYRR